VTEKKQGQQITQEKKNKNKVVTIGLLTPFLSGDFGLMTPSQKKKTETENPEKICELGLTTPEYYVGGRLPKKKIKMGRRLP
jgi:hypothetical protein